MIFHLKSLKKLKKNYFIIESELIADVDLGIFLSSGIDSTLIASIASKYQKKNKHIFFRF